MILMYHKVDLMPLTEWWVSVDSFARQMSDLRGYEVVYLDDYDIKNPDQVVITFDGMYENVLKYAAPILAEFNYPFEVFITSDYLGRGNEFDTVEPYAKFCSEDQLKETLLHGGRIQWHTKSHAELVNVAESVIQDELSVPTQLKQMFADPHFKWFAYPHGTFCEKSYEYARDMFSGALSVEQGSSTDRFALNRKTVLENSRFSKTQVSVIIPNYNYGHFVGDAIESVLNQTMPADEILVIDDCSTDSSRPIIEKYARSDRVKACFNESNLGIIDNFKKAVSMTSGEYICFLGADNLFRADYIEKCKQALDKNLKSPVAYTNMQLFGPLAESLAESYKAIKLKDAPKSNWSNFDCQMPEPEPDFVSQIKKRNFIHGSSMYRRSCYEGVGGYLDEGKAEDHSLFVRMLEKYGMPKHVPEALLLYRQHSSNQANTVLTRQFFQRQFFQMEKQFFQMEKQYSRELITRENQFEEERQALRAEIALREKAHSDHIELFEKEIKIRDDMATELARELDLMRQELALVPTATSSDYQNSSINSQSKIVALFRRKAAVIYKSIRSALSSSFIGKIVRRVRKRFKRSISPSSTIAIDASALASINNSLVHSNGNLLITFPIINWDFRWQRPQQLVSRLRSEGFSVLYLAMTVAGEQRRYSSNSDALSNLGISNLESDIFQIWTKAYGNVNIYTDKISDDDLSNLKMGIESLLEKLKYTELVLLVQFPGWWPVVNELKKSFGAKVVFDCMDNHAGFSTNTSLALEQEEELISESDLVIASSMFLHTKCKALNDSTLLIKNATDPEHFGNVASNGKIAQFCAGPVVGYHGAISDWFDIELIEYCAVERPDINFVLIGATTGCDTSTVEGMHNVFLLGEIPYLDLPGYVTDFDIGIIPFKINPLTNATNPVKFYEYVSAGKAVVATNLPELEPYLSLCLLSNTHSEFLDNIDLALGGTNSSHLIEERMRAASLNSWDERASVLSKAIKS